MTIELTYKEMRVLRRALGSRSSILEDRKEKCDTVKCRLRSKVECDIVDDLYERLSDDIQEYEEHNKVPATFAELLEAEEV